MEKIKIMKTPEEKIKDIKEQIVIFKESLNGDGPSEARKWAEKRIVNLEKKLNKLKIESNNGNTKLGSVYTEKKELEFMERFLNIEKQNFTDFEKRISFGEMCGNMELNNDDIVKILKSLTERINSFMLR